MERLGVVVAVIAAFVGIVPSAGAAVQFRTANVAVGSGLRHANQFTPGGGPTACNSLVAVPGQTSTAATFGYIAFRDNSSVREPACVTTTVSTACTGTDAVISETYSPSYNPPQVVENWIGDLGGSPPASTSYSYFVAPGAPFQTVIETVNSAGNCTDVTLTWTSDRPWASTRPNVRGVPTVGGTLTDFGDIWVDSPDVERQWRRCDSGGANCSDIAGANETSYVPTSGDIGHTLTVRESATDGALTSTSESPPTSEVFIPIETHENQSLSAGDPAYTGTLNVTFTPSRCSSPKTTPTVAGGNPHFYDTFPLTSLINEPACIWVAQPLPMPCQLLAAVYSPAFAPASIAQNYVADGVSANMSYTLAPGATAVAVTSSFSGLACSSYSLIVGSQAPFATERPAIAGSATEGSAETATPGTWSGSPTFAYSWRRCDTDGGDCVPIDGATGASYTPTADDTGHRLVVRVTATQVNSVSADSPPTEVIAAAPPGSGGGPQTPPGSGGGPLTPLDTVAPVFAAASLTNRTFAVDSRGRAEAPATARAKRGTKFRYTLSEDARVVFRIERATAGRKVGRTCRKQTRSNRKRRRCTRYVLAGRFAQASRAGANIKPFSGRIGRKSLKPASYRVVLVATDASGNASQPRTLKFKVVRR